MCDKPKGASIVLDDAFTPDEITFTETDSRISFFREEQSIRVQVFKKGEYRMSMRIPLYASVALAQMFTNTLNGQKLRI